MDVSIPNLKSFQNKKEHPLGFRSIPLKHIIPPLVNYIWPNYNMSPAWICREFKGISLAKPPKRYLLGEIGRCSDQRSSHSSRLQVDGVGEEYQVVPPGHQGRHQKMPCVQTSGPRQLGKLPHTPQNYQMSPEKGPFQ